MSSGSSFRPRRRLAMLATAAVTLIAAAASAQEAPASIAAAIERHVRPLLGQYDIPGIVVGVSFGDRRAIVAYGVASKDWVTPAGPDTLFEIGSLSKTVTATFFGYAEALGKIALDDHPSTLMPALRGRPIDAASLLQLGTYTAGGLPLQFPDAVSDADMPLYFADWKPDAAPGTQRRYSNPSVGLFGHLTARAMGGDFAELVERDLLPKLGLDRSHIHVPTELMADYAWGYDRAGRPIRVNPGVFDAEAYGVKASARDMLHFVEIQLRPERLDPILRHAVEATQIGYFEVGPMVQGLGWEQYPYPIALDRLLAGNSAAMAMEAHPARPLLPPRQPSGAILFNKTGSTNGFGAYAAFVPAKKIGLVLLANKNFPIPARITAAHALLEALDALGDRP